MNTPRHTLLQLRNVMHDVTLPEWWVAILQSANFSIITTDENGLILSFNPAAERMLGYHAAVWRKSANGPICTRTGSG